MICHIMRLICYKSELALNLIVDVDFRKMKRCRFTFAKKEAYSRQMVALLQKDSPYLAAVNKQLTNEWHSLRLQLHVIIFSTEYCCCINMEYCSTSNANTLPTKHRVDLKTSKRCQVVLAKSCPKVDNFLEPVCHLCQSPHNPKDVLKSTRKDRNKTTLSHLLAYYIVPPK